MTRVVAPQAVPASTSMTSPISSRASPPGVGTPNATTRPANARMSPTHCQRRNLGQRELHRDLIEPPAQAERDREHGRGGVERTGNGGDVLFHCGCEQ